MKIGDRVKFKGDGINIPEYFTDNDHKIPSRLIIHGSTMLGTDYNKNYATIVNKYNEFLIVRWTSDEDKIMQLGFKEESLELIDNKINKNNKIMSTIKEFAKNLVRKKSERILIENDLKDECGNYTQEAKDLIMDLMCRENETYLLELIEKKEAQNKDKD
jgi:hypothetical protein